MAAHSALQHETSCPLLPVIGKPSLAPMNTTTASGWSCLTCRAASFAQLTMKVVEMPVPRCGSRITRTPAGASSCARSESSGWDIESPVTSSVCSARLGGAGAPIVLGSKASGVTGGMRPASPAAPSWKPPGPPRLGSGESHAVALWLTLASGRRSAIQPAGRPTASTASRPTPEFISSPALRIEAPSKRISRTAARSTTRTASRARKRRWSDRSKRPIRLSSRGRRGAVNSEAEVDERRNALAGDGCAHERYDKRQHHRERHRAQALEVQLDPRQRARRQQLETDHDNDRREHRRARAGRRAGDEQPREERAEQREALRAEQDPAEDDEMECHEPAQPRGELQAAAEGVLGDQAEPVEGAPQQERPD